MNVGSAGGYNTTLGHYVEPKPSTMSVTNNWNSPGKNNVSLNQKDQNGINYHKKLKDDFDRYERFIRD